jgi:hypothetical protein
MVHKYLTIQGSLKQVAAYKWREYGKILCMNGTILILNTV